MEDFLIKNILRVDYKKMKNILTMYNMNKDIYSINKLIQDSINEYFKDYKNYIFIENNDNDIYKYIKLKLKSNSDCNFMSLDLNIKIKIDEDIKGDLYLIETLKILNIDNIITFDETSKNFNNYLCNLDCELIIREDSKLTINNYEMDIEIADVFLETLDGLFLLTVKNELYFYVKYNFKEDLDLNILAYDCNSFILNSRKSKDIHDMCYKFYKDIVISNGLDKYKEIVMSIFDFSEIESELDFLISSQNKLLESNINSSINRNCSVKNLLDMDLNNTFFNLLDTKVNNCLFKFVETDEKDFIIDNNNITNNIFINFITLITSYEFIETFRKIYILYKNNIKLY